MEMVSAIRFGNCNFGCADWAVQLIWFPILALTDILINEISHHNLWEEAPSRRIRSSPEGQPQRQVGYPGVNCDSLGSGGCAVRFSTIGISVVVLGDD